MSYPAGSSTSPSQSSGPGPDQGTSPGSNAYLILAINAGSSSLKTSLFRALRGSAELEQLAEAQISGLSGSSSASPAPTFTYAARANSDGAITDKPLHNGEGSSHAAALDHVFDHMVGDAAGLPQVSARSAFAAVCHRVVHGGEYARPQRIDADTFHRLAELSDLAPLHNATALDIIKVVHEKLPKAINVACFDSAFHASIPKHIHTYPIDPETAKRNKLRKYGFHGISYSFITQSTAKFLQKPPEKLNLIALHLGSGASACAIRNGQSLDTSMGLTPVSGLPGGSRSGDVDPSLIFHFTHNAGKPSPTSSKDMHVTQAEEILNKKSGFAAMTGTSDFGEISGSSDPQSQLMVDIFTDRILGFIGSYYVKLEGQVDALVFAGGIGEKGSDLRRRLVEKSACLGFQLDTSRNKSSTDHVVVDITKAGSKHRVLICQTDEQLEMARGYAREPDSF